MVTRLTPARLVSTMMGSWFLATAFSQYLAAIISQFTSVEEAEGSSFPIPSETVDVYGDVYGQIALVSLGSALVLLAMVPLLKRWMHVGVQLDD